jgi:23S rRNA (cytosine1962-C5)-methyltransferase
MSVPSPILAETPSVMRTTGWDDYRLIDSGAGRKLESYGPYRVARPEPQCLWTPRLPDTTWAAADAVFDPAEEEDAGHWRFPAPLEPRFPLAWGSVRFYGRFTAFRHLGFFPEQAANWAWLEGELRGTTGPDGAAPRVLNLFGYTGVASLVCAAAGAAVTHVDASKRAIGWARENAELAGMSGAPVRWICEDARRYVQREVRRGSRYEGIILDPPKYGRGPAGEVWRLYDDLPELMRQCAELLSDGARFLIANVYAERISGLALAALMQEALQGRGGRIDWGELALTEEAGDRAVGLSFFARWTADAG